MSSRQFEEMQEEAGNRALASSLGISYDELCELQWEIDTNESNDGWVNEYIITFHDDSPIDILEKIDGMNLEGRYVYLPPWEVENNYDYDFFQDELDWDIGSSEQLKVLNSHLSSTLNLLDIMVNNQTEFDLIVMLHSHVVAAMEAFLSSTFIHEVVNSEIYTRKLIERDPYIGKKELSLKEIYKKYENIQTIVATYLKDLIFHRLKKVKPMYKSVLGIDFGDISWLFKAVKTRHHCAHRAGFDKEGNKVAITKDDIRELVVKCKELSSLIDSKIQEENTT